jgi:hypothetical protein
MSFYVVLISQSSISFATLTLQLISTLRSNDYFGQYGRISKIILVKRTPPGTQVPVVGLYITYHRREDAARCITAVDGSASPGGGNEIMRASYGTTKYCMSFLRGVNCPDHNCMNLHEWGDEKDCFTKEDLTTLYLSWQSISWLLADNRMTGNIQSRTPRSRERMSSWVRRRTTRQVCPLSLFSGCNFSSKLA